MLKDTMANSLLCSSVYNSPGLLESPVSGWDKQKSRNDGFLLYFCTNDDLFFEKLSISKHKLQLHEWMLNYLLKYTYLLETNENGTAKLPCGKQYCNTVAAV